MSGIMLANFSEPYTQILTFIVTINNQLLPNHKYSYIHIIIYEAEWPTYIAIAGPRRPQKSNSVDIYNQF